jgi:hypothetical protein
VVEERIEMKDLIAVNGDGGRRVQIRVDPGLTSDDHAWLRVDFNAVFQFFTV